MRVLVAGGGTGGHVVPALAVSDELKRRGAEVLFVGSERPADRELVEAAGYDFEAIPAGKLRRYFALTTLLEPFRSYRGYRRSRALIKRFQPDVVFAKGGFVALPVMRAAHRLKVPIVLHESDAVPGWANRVGGRWAEAVAVSFPPERLGWRPRGEVVYTGNPIRTGVGRGNAAGAFQAFKLDPKQPLVLVIGGSQGALSINRLVAEALPELLPEAQIVHQAGRGKAEELQKAAHALPPRLQAKYRLVEYLRDELFDLYAAADLIVSRASAGGPAEIAAVGKPSILIPLPSAASDHQRANAEVFADAKAAVVLDEEALTAGDLTRAIKRLLHDPTLRSRMGRAAKTLAKPDAATEVADVVWKAGSHD